MIGWKIVCKFEKKEVVCEVVGYAMNYEAYIIIPVYHDGCIKMPWFNPEEDIKVVERK